MIEVLAACQGSGVLAELAQAEAAESGVQLVCYPGSESEEPVPAGVAGRRLFGIEVLAVCQGSGELAQAEAAESGVPLVCQGSGVEEPVPAGVW